MPSAFGDANLQQARQLLTGEHKDTERARKLLLSIVQTARGERPDTVVWAAIYLGYIEDRAGNRASAMDWYRSALTVNGAPSGSLSMARSGLQQPLYWIKHLDEGTPANAYKPPAPLPPGQDGKAYVTPEPPEGLTLARNLSASERRANFEALWSLIDANYAHFKLKSIDWEDVGRRYRARLDGLTGDDDFYLMMFQFVNELKDTHSWLQGYKAPVLADVAGVATDLFQGKPYIVAGAKAGWEVLAVDGMPPAAKMESLRPYLHACSSERAFQRQAGRSLLAGKDGETVSVQVRAPGGQVETLSLRRGGRRGRPPAPNVGIPLTRQRFVHFGRHASGLGYIQIESFNGREEIGSEFDRALEALRDTPGLILDIRDNPGGFGHPEILGRFLRKRTMIGFSHVKKGPGHEDFTKIKLYASPSGPWQYTRPVALLVNDVTGSAADLFATELRSAGSVITVGSTTHGNLSGVATYAVLPCGLVVRISNGYISDAKDRPTEVNGNVPDISVEPDIQDYLSGRDPVVERAIAVLMKSSAK